MTSRDRCPPHIVPAEWRAFLTLLFHYKFREQLTIPVADSSWLKWKRRK